jgi:hypothetical protein
LAPVERIDLKDPRQAKSEKCDPALKKSRHQEELAARRLHVGINSSKGDQSITVTNSCRRRQTRPNRYAACSRLAG